MMVKERRKPTTQTPIGLGLPKPRRSPGAAVAALAVHLLLFWLILEVVPALDFEASNGSGPGEPGGGGGGGGGRAVQMVLLQRSAPPPAPVPPPVVPPPEPVIPPPTPPVVPVPEVVAVAPPSPDTVVANASDSGAGQGTGQGTGRGSGSGTGEGSGSGSGRGSGRGSGTGPGSGGGEGRAHPPEPRQLILPPPDIPGGLRGVTIAVTFMVGPDGRVVEVSFDPEPDDGGFAKKLREVMRSYRFRPARGSDGLPTAGSTVVTLRF